MISDDVAVIQVWAAATLTAAVAGALILSFRSHARLATYRPALGAGALCGVLLLAQGAVALSVAAGTAPASADGAVLAWMIQHRTPELSWFFTQVSAAGGMLGTVIVAALAAAACWVTGRRRAAVAVVAAAVGAALLNVSFKSLYGRARPPSAVQVVPETSLSFPSGHALESCAVLGIVTVVAVAGLSARRYRVLLVCVSIVLTGVIGLSRLYLGVHWLTDVLAGWLLGGAWLVLCATVARSGRPGAGLPAPRGSAEPVTDGPHPEEKFGE